MLSFKTFLLRYHLLIALLIFAILAVLFSTMEGFRTDYLLSFSIGLAAFVYFVQKQKLQEMMLFKDLFTEYNYRYESLNQELHRIISTASGKALAKADKNFLEEYFNLCGEEYFYYTEGIVPPQVWKEWKNGMRIFFQDDRVRKQWELEKGTDSYYGLHSVVDRMTRAR